LRERKTSKMLVTICVSLLFLTYRHVDATCSPPITVKDIDDAAAIADKLYYINAGDVGLNIAGYVIEHIFDSTLQGEGLRAIVATNSSSKTTVVCFRGTAGGEQMKDQMESILAREWKTLPGNNGRVMKYFGDAVDSLDVINKISISNGNRFIVAGHSLGGAMATIFATQLYQRDHDFWKGKNVLITFGSPRVGDAQFSSNHDLILSPKKKLRIVYNRDIITHLPLRLLGFQHVSSELYITVKKRREWYWCGPGKWFRCFRKVPYDYSWKVCPYSQFKRTCGNKFGLRYYTKGDHPIKKYLAAADKLRADGGEKVRNLYQSLCNIKK